MHDGRREPGWVQHAIWWQVYPLGFVGAYPPPSGEVPGPDEHRLRRLIGWLDHVAELGASGVALGPIFGSAGHGYDTLDHLRLDPRLGTDDDFDALVDECHRRGLRVQLDGVFNHVSREHPLVLAALGGDDGAARRLRVGDDGDFATFEGYGELVALNHDAPEVAELVTHVMTHWLDRGADAWRLDAAYAVPTMFWADVLPRVRRAYPDVWFEAEVIHGDYPAFVRDSTVDTVTQYELWKAIWSSINDHNLFELDHALARHDAMLDSFVPTTFIGNHDVTRIASRIDDQQHLPHAVALLALLGGTPTVYAGDEYGLRAVKEERAGGDDAIRPTFPAAPQDLNGADPATFELYQRLLGLRRRHPWLHTARSSTTRLENEACVLRLEHGDEALLLHLNLGDQPRALSGEVLAADPETGSDALAPHGWAVTTG